MDDYDLDERYDDLEDAIEAVEAYKRDDPKSAFADYNIRDNNGKIVWNNDAWQEGMDEGGESISTEAWPGTAEYKAKHGTDREKHQAKYGKSDVEKIKPYGYRGPSGSESDDAPKEKKSKKESAGRGSDEDYESIQFEKAPPGAKAERMVKHIKKGYAKDGRLTDKERSTAYATAWKQHNKEKNESVNQGDEMTRVTEGEIQQAQSIVTAKTMVDRVGRWIEELSGMENDTLLQLGDQIRDEMGQEQAKGFISAVAPAIQQALENLKATRETLATGVRTLTGEQQPAEMLGAQPGAEGEEVAPAAPDEMNMPAEEPAADEFAAAEPAAGGLEDAGREQRESIEYQNRLLRVLAG